MGARPPKNFFGAKNWKIAIGAYSSEFITPERKRISQRLKRLWNHKTMAYKVYIRPWPLTPEVNTVHAFACTSAKIPVFGDSLKIFCCNPRQTFTVNSPRGALQVWKILWTLTHKRRWTIRTIETLGIFAVSHLPTTVLGNGVAAWRTWMR